MQKKFMYLLFFIAINSLFCGLRSTTSTNEETSKSTNVEKKIVKEESEESSKPTNAEKKITKQESKEASKSTNVEKKITKQEIDNNPNIYTIDDIAVLIITTEGEKVITRSQINKPSFTGADRSLDDIIFETLVYFDSKRMKNPDPDEDTINRFFASIQKEHNITMQDLEDLFKASGYTIEEVREQYKIMQAVNGMLDFRIRSNITVPPRSSVEKYYDENPIFTEVQYQLQHVIIPFDLNSEDNIEDNQWNNQKNNIRNSLDTLNWNKPFFIKESEMEESKLKLISSLKEGEVSAIQETSSGFELYKLVKKEESRLVPLEDRRDEIVDKLRIPRYNQLLQEYKKTLFDGASILYF